MTVVVYLKSRIQHLFLPAAQRLWGFNVLDLGFVPPEHQPNLGEVFSTVSQCASTYIYVCKVGQPEGIVFFQIFHQEIVHVYISGAIFVSPVASIALSTDP